MQKVRDEQQQVIDREAHCPFLLRVFYNSGSHNRKELYAQLEDAPLANELHIYTWPDATLREIGDLIQESNSDAKQPNVRMGFSVVYPDRNGNYVMKKAGWVHSNHRKSADESKTLASLGFQPGDFLDVALLQ